MRTMAEQIEDLSRGMPILGAVIGPFEDYVTGTHGWGVPPSKENVVLKWDEARPYLNRTWDTGFGGAQCPPVMVWTLEHLIGVSEYDGATSVVALPRHPIDHRPGYL